MATRDEYQAILAFMTSIVICNADRSEVVPTEAKRIGHERDNERACVGKIGRVSWDDTANQIRLPAVGLYPVRIATEAAGSGAPRSRYGSTGVGTVVA